MENPRNIFARESTIVMWAVGKFRNYFWVE